VNADVAALGQLSRPFQLPQPVGGVAGFSEGNKDGIIGGGILGETTPVLGAAVVVVGEEVVVVVVNWRVVVLNVDAVEVRMVDEVVEGLVVAVDETAFVVDEDEDVI
jgi:hypothetical protein